MIKPGRVIRGNILDRSSTDLQILECPTERIGRYGVMKQVGGLVGNLNLQKYPACRFGWGFIMDDCPL